jgi:hypothetical protein
MNTGRLDHLVLTVASIKARRPTPGRADRPA